MARCRNPGLLKGFFRGVNAPPFPARRVWWSTDICARWARYATRTAIPSYHSLCNHAGAPCPRVNRHRRFHFPNVGRSRSDPPCCTLSRWPGTRPRICAAGGRRARAALLNNGDLLRDATSPADRHSETCSRSQTRNGRCLSRDTTCPMLGTAVVPQCCRSATRGACACRASRRRAATENGRGEPLARAPFAAAQGG